jgi:hypothetical protein
VIGFGSLKFNAFGSVFRRTMNKFTAALLIRITNIMVSTAGLTLPAWKT